LYVANSADQTLTSFSIDPLSGALSDADTVAAAGTTPSALFVDPHGKYLYSANTGSGIVTGFAIDQASGHLVSLGAPYAAVYSGRESPAIEAPDSFTS